MVCIMFLFMRKANRIYQFPKKPRLLSCFCLYRWDDIWVNEGLTTLFENIIVNQVLAYVGLLHLILHLIIITVLRRACMECDVA